MAKNFYEENFYLLTFLKILFYPHSIAQTIPRKLLTVNKSTGVHKL
jgi:hypothetical protein